MTTAANKGHSDAKIIKASVQLSFVALESMLAAEVAKNETMSIHACQKPVESKATNLRHSPVGPNLGNSDSITQLRPVRLYKTAIGDSKG